MLSIQKTISVSNDICFSACMKTYTMTKNKMEKIHGTQSIMLFNLNYINYVNVIGEKMLKSDNK